MLRSVGQQKARLRHRAEDDIVHKCRIKVARPCDNRVDDRRAEGRGVRRREATVALAGGRASHRDDERAGHMFCEGVGQAEAAEQNLSRCVTVSPRCVRTVALDPWISKSHSLTH